MRSVALFSGCSKVYTACFEVVLSIPGAASLKDRRSVLKSLKERIKNRFNVSVIECSEDGKWQTGRLGLALCAISASAAQQSAQAIIDFIEQDGRADILEIVKDY